MSPADTPEPPPRVGTGDVWIEVITAVGRVSRLLPTLDGLREDMWSRWRFGLAKYGTPLQRDNGRDHMADALQEALDLVAYAWAARGPWWLRWGAVLFAWAIRRRLPPSSP